MNQTEEQKNLRKTKRNNAMIMLAVGVYLSFPLFMGRLGPNIIDLGYMFVGCVLVIVATARLMKLAKNERTEQDDGNENSALSNQPTAATPSRLARFFRLLGHTTAVFTVLMTGFIFSFGEAGMSGVPLGVGLSATLFFYAISRIA